MILYDYLKWQHKDVMKQGAMGNAVIVMLIIIISVSSSSYRWTGTPNCDVIHASLMLENQEVL